jgi:hypothetical protein
LRRSNPKAAAWSGAPAPFRGVIKALWGEGQGPRAHSEEDKVIEILEPTKILEPTEIPVPEETGSSGTQLIGTGEVFSIAKESPLEGLPIVQAVEGLVATRSRCFGGEVGTTLLAGSFAQLSYDLQTTKRELNNTREELKRTNGELSDYKIRVAVLQERVIAYLRERLLKNLSITIGTALVVIGMGLYRNNLKYDYIVSGLGALLLIFGWFSKPREARK